MPSVLDPTIPVDGVPPQKPNFRANFLAIKQELEHGGFFTQAGSNAVERLVIDKLRENEVSVLDFGAEGDGASDDTVAIQRAIDHLGNLKQGGHSVLLFRGRFRFDPTLLDWSVFQTDPKTGVTLLVDGILYPQTPLIISDVMHLHGLGGAVGIQFSRWPSCAVEAPAGQPAIIMRGENGCSLYQVSVYGNGDAPALSIEHPGPYPIPDFSIQNALFLLDRVAVLGSQGTFPNGHGLQIRHAYWVWIKNFAINTHPDGGYCIYLLDDGGHSNSAAGIIFIENGVTSQKNIYWTRTANSGDVQGSMTIKNLLFESAVTPFIALENAGQPVDQLVLERCDFADATGDFALIDTQLCAGEVRSLRIIDCPTTKLIEGRMPRNLWVQQTNLVNDTGTINAFSGDYPRGGSYFLDGEYDTRDAFRNAEMQPGICPVTVLACEQDPAAWTSVSIGFDATAGHLAPDGSLSAHLLQNTGAGLVSARAFDADVTLDAGDWLIAGCWVKGAVAGSRLTSEAHVATVDISTANFTLDGADAPATLANDRSRLADAGWFPLVRFWQVGGASGTAGVNFAFALGATGDAYYVWKPFLLHADGSVWTARDVARLAARITVIDQNQKTGVLTMLPHQTFRTGAGATGARPNASAVGVGAQWFDATLNKPIWSDGTNWRDAVGTLV